MFSRWRNVPTFNVYFPSLEDATREQQRFYRWLIKQFNKGKAPDVQGNLSYLFLFLYSIIEEFLTHLDYSYLAQWFDFFRKHYTGKTKIAPYLDFWQRDAAMLSGRWEDAWEFGRRHKLRPDFAYTCAQRFGSLNIQADDLHSLLLSDHGLTNTGLERLKAVNTKAARLLEIQQETDGTDLISALFDELNKLSLKKSDFDRLADDCDYLISAHKLHKAYQRDNKLWHLEDRMVFAGSPRPMQTEYFEYGSIIKPRPNPTIKFYAPTQMPTLLIYARAKRLVREAENLVREEEGLPRIAEGWISETKLFNLIKSHYRNMRIVQHARPDWLHPQHLDIYLPDYNIGIEYQGAQHFRPVDYFGGEEAFEQQKKRDAKKKRLCKKHGCLLLEVLQGYNEDEILKRIRQAIEISAYEC